MARIKKRTKDMISFIREKYHLIKRMLISYYYSIVFNKKKCYNLLHSIGYDFNEADLCFKESLIPDSLEFSFIVPVYNSEKYLKRCIDALLSQKNFNDYEIICVNDGSTDNSVAILKSYGDRIKIINQDNQGIAISRNNGVLCSRGKYVIFVDNDDIVSSNFLESVSSVINKSNADIVQTSYSCIDELGNFVSEHRFENCIFDRISKNIKDKTRGYIWGCAIRKSIFKNIKFPTSFWYEDMITKMALLRFCKKIVVTSEILYYYRVHNTNASKILWKSKNVKSVDQYWLAVQLNEFCKRNLLALDDYSYSVLLGEFGKIMWWRTRDLEFQARIAIYKLASYYIKDQKKNNSFVLTDEEQKLEQALLSGSFIKWLNLFEQ